MLQNSNTAYIIRMQEDQNTVPVICQRYFGGVWFLGTNV
jgi:hypothetical protein